MHQFPKETIAVDFGHQFPKETIIPVNFLHQFPKETIDVNFLH